MADGTFAIEYRHLFAGADQGGPGNLSIPIRFYYRIRELNF
jgi:hypothetical protein